MVTLHILFIASIVLAEGFSYTLSVLNFNYVCDKLVNNYEEAKEFGVDDARDLIDRRRINLCLGLLKRVLSLGFLLGAYYTGALTWLAHQVNFLGNGLWMTAIEGVMFFMTFQFAKMFLDIPTSLVSWAVQKAYDYSRDSLTKHFKNQAISIVQGTVLNTLAISLQIILILATPKFWWLVIPVTFLLISEVFSFINYHYITPYTVGERTKMRASEYSNMFDGLMEKFDIDPSKISIINASESTKTGNAMALNGILVSGITVFDNLLENYDKKELEGVLGHEFSHFEHGDSHWSRAEQFVTQVIKFGAMHLIIFNLPVYEMFAFPTAVYCALAVASDFMTFPSTLFGVVTSMLHRGNEQRADREGAEVAGADNMVSALITMNRQNNSCPFTHPLVEALKSSHPSTGNRVEFLKNLDQ